jgi:hypothetical protein
MTREEAMEYRRNAPYDAFGDYSVFEDGEKPERKDGEEDEENLQVLRSRV